MGGKVTVPVDKKVDSNGQVNNNVVVEVMENNSNLLLFMVVELGIVCLIGFVQLYIYYHCNSLKNLKKKYGNGNNQQQNNP